MTTMFGPFQDLAPKAARQASRRRGRERLGELVNPDELEDAAACCQEQQETDKNMEEMMTILRDSSKLDHHGRVGFSELVFNPKSFAQTVENIFTLSFLVKDGRVTLADNDDPSKSERILVRPSPQRDFHSRRTIPDLPLSLLEPLPPPPHTRVSDSGRRDRDQWQDRPRGRLPSSIHLKLLDAGVEEDEGGTGPQFCVPDGPQDDGGPPQDGNSRVAGSIAIAIAAAGQASRPWLPICSIQEEAQRVITKKLIPYFFFLQGEAGGASHGVPRRHRERVLPEAPAQGGIQLRVSPRATRKKKRRRRKRERADGGPKPRAVTKRTDLNFTTSSSPPQRARGLLCVVGDKGQRPRAVFRARLQGPEPRRKVPQLRRYPGEGAKPARPFSSLHSRLPLVSHYTATPQTQLNAM